MQNFKMKNENKKISILWQDPTRRFDTLPFSVLPKISSAQYYKIAIFVPLSLSIQG
jgi:hypothetical protein